MRGIMRKQVRNKWLDWGAEFSFSVVFLSLVALGLGFHQFFDTAEAGADINSMLAEVALVGGLAIVVLLLVFSLVDVRKRLRFLKKEHDRLIADSKRDVLTGSLNRETFVSNAKSALAKDAKNKFFALFLIDVDNFKQVNDTYGHPAGDKVLVFVAEHLRLHFPEASVGRLGGDEFAVLIEHTDPITDNWAKDLCKEFAAGLANKVNLGTQRLAVSASIGIALAPVHGRTWSSLFTNADMALYASKKSGRACSTLFQEEMLTDIRNEKALVRELRAAILLRHLRVAYQPIVDADGQLVAFEALLRWRHALRGVIPPDVFIPVAERALMIGEIGNYVVRQVCEDLAELPDVAVNINLSANQISMPDLKQKLLDILAETRTEPHRIVLEITESASLAANQRIAAQISSLQDVGFRIALDDFGMGLSLIHILTLPTNREV